MKLICQYVPLSKFCVIWYVANSSIVYYYSACSMEDGLLLKPTHPAMSLDSTFTQRAFGEGGPKGQLWAGYTVYKQSLVSHYNDNTFV